MSDSTAMFPPERREAPLDDLLAYGQEESDNALNRKDKSLYDFWQGWCAALERVRASSPAAHAEPTRFDLLEDPTRGLHAVLTRFGLASRTDFMPLVTALVQWAADAYRSSLPAAHADEELPFDDWSKLPLAQRIVALVTVLRAQGSDGWHGAAVRAVTRELRTASPAAHAERPDTALYEAARHVWKTLHDTDLANNADIWRYERNLLKAALAQSERVAFSEPAAHAERTLQSEAIRLDEPYLHHLREAAYDWAIESIDDTPAGPRRACIIMSRNVVSLVDELRQARAVHAERPQYPIPLNEEQEQAVKSWAADDRLWTTQDTVEINLRTFARMILKLRAARSERPDIVEEILQRIELSQKGSIGSDLNVFMPQISVEEVKRWRAALSERAPETLHGKR
jgi:hypothetical protein